jgi:hypothetical protein
LEGRLELREGFAQALGGRGKLGVADRGAVAAEEDGVHHRKGAADAEGEAEKEADQGAERYAHGFDDVMVGAVRKTAGAN